MVTTWRVGEHYGIHVYEGDRPVATFHNEGDARQAVADRGAVQRLRELAERLELARPYPNNPYDEGRVAGIHATAERILAALDGSASW